MCTICKVCIYVTGNMGIHVGKRFCWATYVSLKTYSYLKSSNNCLFQWYQFSRASTMETWSFGTHIMFKEISASIFRTLLGDIDLMIFQIVFFSREKTSSSTALCQVGKRRLCILNNKMMQYCLKLYISLEGCGKSLVFITGYSRFSWDIFEHVESVIYHTKTADTVSCKSLKTSAIEWAHSIATMRHAVAIVFLLLTFIQICKNHIRWCKFLCASALSILSYFSFFFCQSAESYVLPYVRPWEYGDRNSSYISVCVCVCFLTGLVGCWTNSRIDCITYVFLLV